MKIILYGQVVAQKNDKIATINRRTGKPFILTSKAVREWKEAMAWQLKTVTPIEGQVSIILTFYNKDKRKRDLDNMTSSVLDALKNNQIIDDDSCFIVPEIHSFFGGIDKQNPRVEIMFDRTTLTE